MHRACSYTVLKWQNPSYCKNQFLLVFLWNKEVLFNFICILFLFIHVWFLETGDLKDGHLDYITKCFRDQCHRSNFKLLRAVIREKLPLGKAWYSSSVCGIYVSKIMAFLSFFHCSVLGKSLTWKQGNLRVYVKLLILINSEI